MRKPVARQTSISSMFSRAPKPEAQAPLSADDQKRLSAEWDARGAEQQRTKMASERAIATAIQAWECTQNPHWLFWAQNESREMERTLC